MSGADPINHEMANKKILMEKGMHAWVVDGAMCSIHGRVQLLIAHAQCGAQ